MKNVFYLSLILMLLINLSSPAMGSWKDEEQFACPVCGTKDYYIVTWGGGGDFFMRTSRFQCLAWPFTEPEILFACQKCHFTCLMWDFNKIPKEKISEIKKALEGVILPAPVIARNIFDAEQRGTYKFIPMSARIPVAERVYKALGRDDDFWLLFYRMAAYHYDKEGIPEKASAARRKVLEYAERLIADKSHEGLLKKLYLYSGAMHFLLRDFASAREDFKKGKTAPFYDPSNTNESELFDELIDLFLNTPSDQIDLIIAIDSGKALKVAEILDKNPDLVRESFGFVPCEYHEDSTPLHFAVRKGNLDIIKLLISRGADVNAKNKWGKQPLFLAIGYLWGDTKPVDLMKMLLDSGADIEARDKSDRTPLIYAVQFHSTSCDKENLLISRGAKVNVKDEDGMTPLHYAIEEKIEKVVKLLIAHGADVSAKNNKGETPIMLAQKAGLKDIVELLRKQGARE